MSRGTLARQRRRARRARTRITPQTQALVAAADPELATGLSDALAATWGFYVKAHGFHWNVVGPDFPELHALFERVYSDAWEAVDLIAEAIRTLDAAAPSSPAELQKLSNITPTSKAEDGPAMVEELSSDNEKVITVLKAALALTADNPGIENMLQGRVELHEKHGWMLRATASGKTLTAGANGSMDFPLSDRGRAWDAAAANKRWQAACGIDGDKGDWAKFHTGFFWYDSSDPNKVTSHKLPFVDVVGGDATAVWRGVTAGAARLGSTQIPSADEPKVQSKMASYYGKAAEQYDDPGIKAPWETAAAAGTATLVLARAGRQAAAKAMGKCADCGHMALAHGGSDNMGACSMNGCSCTGFDTGGSGNDGDADDAHSSGVAVYENEPLAFQVQTATNGLVDVTLSGNSFYVGGSGTYSVASGASNQNLAVFVFDDSFAKAPGGTKGRAGGRGGKKGWQDIKIPPTRKVTPVGGKKVSPHDADTDEFDVGMGGDMPLPVDHLPGEKKPKRNPSPKAPASTLPPAGADLAWVATLAPEGHATDDGRIFAPGSITWRELPLSLMGMTKTADGHDGAEICGRIDRIWRDGDMIRASGVFDGGDFGQKIASLVNDGTLRGVSVDIAPQKVDMAYRSEVVDDEGHWLDTAPAESTDESPSPLDLLFGGDSQDPIIYVVRKAVLGMATVCPFQAFADAKIEPAASLVAAASDAVWTVTMQAGMVVTATALTAAAVGQTDDQDDDDDPAGAPRDVITASAAGLATDVPALTWFDPPNLPELTALTVDDDGRIYGHAAAWGTCHIGIPGECTTAPHSMTNYSYFHLKEIVCDDGARVNCGTITMDTGHAGQSLGRAAAAAHYDDTGMAVADIVCGEDEFGIWVTGAVRPDADAEAVRRLRGAALSGDWRNVNGNLELVALLAVNVPGFPIPRVRAELTASAAGLEVTALVAAGAHLGLDGLTVEQRGQWAELRTIAADEWGRLNRLALEA